MNTCGATMESALIPGHVHTYDGTHDAGDHMCSDPSCRRWFWAGLGVNHG